MILTGTKILHEVRKGRIVLNPFEEKRITTNSYDLSLGSRLVKYTSAVLDPKKPPEYEEVVLGEEGLIMKQGDFLLGSSEEIVGSAHYVPIVHARSGTARMGLFVHCTADLIDIGFFGNVTFQLYATLPVKIYPHMILAQVSFWVPKGNIELYKGKYQGSSGPTPSFISKDFS